MQHPEAIPARLAGLFLDFDSVGAARMVREERAILPVPNFKVDGHVSGPALRRGNVFVKVSLAMAAASS